MALTHLMRFWLTCHLPHITSEAASIAYSLPNLEASSWRMTVSSCSRVAAGQGFNLMLGLSPGRTAMQSCRTFPGKCQGSQTSSRVL